VNKTIAAVAAAVLAGCSSGARNVSGTLVTARPGDTSVMAISATQFVSSPVAADGSFSVDLPAGSVFRLHFVTHLAGQSSAMGIVTTHGRVLLIDTRATRAALHLGRVGSPDQQLAAATTNGCTADGEGLEAEHGDGDGESDDGRAVDGGEHDGEDADAGDHFRTDAGDHDSADAGHDGEHDDVCQGDDDRRDGGDGDRDGDRDGGSDDRDGGEHR
jgi:hypothetical protein